MDMQRRPVFCPENGELAEFMWKKRQELAEKPRGLSESTDNTLCKAYSNVCSSRAAIKSLKDLSEIKGVGKWVLKQIQEFFKSDSCSCDPEDLAKKGRKPRGAKRYVPQKNSVAYALLITLYRGTTGGNEFMRKQELIDATEASGLSRVPIGPEKGKSRTAQIGSSARDWYSGWSCMKTLIAKGLVVKSSCPAKYMLTQEGREVASDCLLRSGLDPGENIVTAEGCQAVDIDQDSDVNAADLDSDLELTMEAIGSDCCKEPIDVPVESLERFLKMGYSKERVLDAFAEVSGHHPKNEMSSLWPAVLCRLREDEVYGFSFRSHARSNFSLSKHGSQVDAGRNENSEADSSHNGGHVFKSSSSDNSSNSSMLRACSTSAAACDLDLPATKLSRDGSKLNKNILRLPPLDFGERFEDLYEVVFILDDREQFATQGSRSRRIIENICAQFNIKIEVRRLPVGDGIWLARHKHLSAEYVLDFIVERKKVDDLRCSIRDNRYKDQKLRLLRCGLKKLIYIVEGDPNSSEAAESIKTACLTTEILEGFDVQRTRGLPDTLKKFGYLTKAIAQFYRSQLSEDQVHLAGVCPQFNEFIRRCQDLEKLTVSDVFAIQLMQVPQVTEEVATAVLDSYPTILSLARAYSLLDGDVTAQEQMLWKQSDKLINSAASRNIFQFIWGNGQQR